MGGWAGVGAWGVGLGEHGGVGRAWGRVGSMGGGPGLGAWGVGAWGWSWGGSMGMRLGG